MMPKHSIRLLLLACCVLTGCRAEEEPRGDSAAAAAVDRPDSVFAPSEERVMLPSARIYPTLTSYEWYARGEPLMHEGRGYRPAGMPVAASLTEMSKLGEFQGVEYYRRNGDTAAAVYVPVFEGYWQLFRTDAEVIDTTMSAPPPPDPDTAAIR